MRAWQVHIDTTSFTVISGQYKSDAQTVAVTHGHSRDNRADLKQRRLALAMTRQGGTPLLCQTLDGNARDTVTTPHGSSRGLNRMRPLRPNALGREQQLASSIAVQNRIYKWRDQPCSALQREPSEPYRR